MPIPWGIIAACVRACIEPCGSTATRTHTTSDSKNLCCSLMRLRYLGGALISDLHQGYLKFIRTLCSLSIVLNKSMNALFLFGGRISESV